MKGLLCFDFGAYVCTTMLLGPCAETCRSRFVLFLEGVAAAKPVPRHQGPQQFPILWSRMSDMASHIYPKINNRNHVGIYAFSIIINNPEVLRLIAAYCVGLTRDQCLLPGCGWYLVRCVVGRPARVVGFAQGRACCFGSLKRRVQSQFSCCVMV